jgi:uncharacterized membrane protein
MLEDISVSLSPIGGSWPILFLAILAVVVLTLVPYRRRLKGNGGSWRFVALALRLLALLLCLVAALRPSVILKEKKKQASSLVVLFDTSTSMLIGDEVRGQSRWDVEQEIIKQLKEFSKTLGPDIDARFYGFDSKVVEPKETELAKLEKPKGRETALGSAMLEAQQRQKNTSRRISRLVIVSDFTSNHGTDPMEAARQLKGQQVPIIAVGLGTESAGTVHRDIALRDIVTSPTVFVKNKLDVRGSMLVRGFANQQLSVGLYVEGRTDPVAKTQVKVPEGVDVIPITGLSFIPETHGEKRITIKVEPQDGELVVSNNEISSFVTVLAGGLNVRFLQGPNFTWDYLYLSRAIGRAQELHLDGVVIRRPAQEDTSEVDDSDFAPGKYNVYILSDLPADHLTAKQHGLLVEAVKKGAGLIMLGGRASFGAGGWADAVLADILPCEIHAGDGQYEPEGGIKLVPTPLGLDSFILQIGATRAETARLWESMPPILGTNRFGERKALASVLATSPAPDSEPLMMSLDVGKGRVIAYGGDTWVWARALNSEESRIAHRKFWRQTIFWLSHKEDDGENHVKLAVDPRRVAVGEKLELTATASDAKGVPISNVTYECKIEREGPAPATEPVELYNQGNEGRATKYAVENLGQPANYTATVIARRDGKELGRDTARFLVYQDDRELDNPSADLKLARELADFTGGEAVTPEKLMTHLKGIDHSSYTEYSSPKEYKVWDNFPFLLIFAALLTLEWWLRKRHGWV